MGGFGSGGHNLRHRGTVEGWRRIDAAFLQKRGLLTDGWAGTPTWTSDDGETHLINVFGGRDEIRLSYRQRVNGGPWQDVDERVAIEWSPRTYGGAQAYFLCPRCAARRRYLIGAGVRFLCRACHGLVHASSRQRPGDRATRRNQKLRARLGVGQGLGDWIGPKPKGMHARTFDRIRGRIHAAEADVHDDMLAVLNRLTRRTERRPRRTGQPRANRDFWS
jgi:hypothetical protein